MKYIYFSFIFFIVNILSCTSVFAQSWTELGTGIVNNDPPGSVRSIAKDASGNIYVAGDYTNASNVYYVAKWDGTSWSELGASSNSILKSMIHSIAVDASNNVYAAGLFLNASYENYVAKWDGTSWSEMGSGAARLHANSTIYSIATDASGNVYAAGDFISASTLKHYVAKWNGTSWSELGTGAAALSANGAIYTITIDIFGNIYAAGRFTNASGKYYVAKWNGTAWSELAGLNANDQIQTIKTDASGWVYAAGDFTNASGKYYVARWSGASWNELGTGVNALNGTSGIFGLAIDASGVYAAGQFYNAQTHSYVAKWNGSTWSELGGSNVLNPNDVIISLLADPSGVYAGGEFTNTSGNLSVARYGNISTATEDQSERSSLSLYPNPGKGLFHLTVPEDGLITIYNNLGVSVFEQHMPQGQIDLGLSQLPAGLYNVSFEGETKRFGLKMMKE